MLEQGKKVLIFGNDTCPYTTAAREDYARRGFEVEYVNVEKELKGMKKMLNFSGEKKVPVIVEKGAEGLKITVGFGGACRV